MDVFELGGAVGLVLLIAFELVILALIIWFLWAVMRGLVILLYTPFRILAALSLVLAVLTVFGVDLSLRANDFFAAALIFGGLALLSWIFQGGLIAKIRQIFARLRAPFNKRRQAITKPRTAAQQTLLRQLDAERRAFKKAKTTGDLMFVIFGIHGTVEKLFDHHLNGRVENGELSFSAKCEAVMGGFPDIGVRIGEINAQRNAIAHGDRKPDVPELKILAGHFVTMADWVEDNLP